MSKRKLEEEEDSLSTASSDSIDSLGNVGGYRSAKRDRRVRFSERIVFHFPRTQGYTCVPSNGGSTLGMKHKHAFVERTQISDVDDFSDSDDSYDSADSEDGGHCFMPIPQKIRKDILKAAGVKKINKQEAIECMQIRYSRQICGCSCKEFCEPETCSCYVNGINCQVDRDSFPCGCTRDGCRNTNGRHEYDPITVRRHFIDTVVRLRGEKYFWHGTEKEPSSNSQTSTSVISFTSVT